MEGKIYHASPIGGLTELKPNKSSHGKAYVYGTKNFELSLFFGSAKTMRDLDGNYGTTRLDKDSESIPFFYEAYEGALKRRFKGESCYVYELDPTDFEEGKTGFDAEVVSEKPVKVLSCIKIDDIYETLMEAKKNGKAKLCEYSLDEEYQQRIVPHIKNTVNYMIHSQIDKENILQDTIEKYQEIDPELVEKVRKHVEKSRSRCEFCKEKFPEIYKELETEIKNSKDKDLND